MKITHWTIKITWEDKKEEYIADIPDWVAKNVDEYLNHLEEGKEDRIEDILKGKDEAMERFSKNIDDKIKALNEKENE